MELLAGTSRASQKLTLSKAAGANEMMERPLSSRLSLPFNEAEDSSKYCVSHSDQVLYRNQQKIRDLFFDLIRVYENPLSLFQKSDFSQPTLSIKHGHLNDPQQQLTHLIYEIWSSLHKENMGWFANFFLKEYLLTLVHHYLYPLKTESENGASLESKGSMVSPRKLNRLEARMSQPTSHSFSSSSSSGLSPSRHFAREPAKSMPSPSKRVSRQAQPHACRKTLPLPY